MEHIRHTCMIWREGCVLDKVLFSENTFCLRFVVSYFSPPSFLLIKNVQPKLAFRKKKKKWSEEERGFWVCITNPKTAQRKRKRKHLLLTYLQVGSPKPQLLLLNFSHKTSTSVPEGASLAENSVTTKHDKVLLTNPSRLSFPSPSV